MFTEEELLLQENIIEAVLFTMGESVSVDTLSLAVKQDADVTKEACERLVNKYENEYKTRGMKVVRINGKYQMVSNNEYFQNLIAVCANPKKPTLTEAILETLSIVAYKQPITKPEIEDIRGVKSDFSINKLIEYGLIEEQGRLDTAGRPIILGTTELFLRRFGLESNDQLPHLDEQKEKEIETEVEAELSKTFGEPFHLNKDDLANINTDSQTAEEVSTDVNTEKNIEENTNSTTVTDIDSKLSDEKEIKDENQTDINNSTYNETALDDIDNQD